MNAVAPSNTIRRDVISAYVASGAKVLSWVIVSAALFRNAGGNALGTLAMVRATLGLLNYASLGLAPALMRMMAVNQKEISQIPFAVPVGDSPTSALPSASKISSPTSAIVSSAIGLAWLAGVIAMTLIAIYALFFERIHHISRPPHYEVKWLVFSIGAGLVLRLVSEPLSAVLQIQGRVHHDNWILAISEAIWAIGGWFMPDPISIGLWFAFAGFMVLFLRTCETFHPLKRIATAWTAVEWGTCKRLLQGGMVIAVAQLADFLYAPTDFILISFLLPYAGGSDAYSASAYYAPAVQIDSGILIFVTGLAAALLPHATLAHVAGRSDELRAYYVRGTLLSIAILLPVAFLTWAFSPRIFQLWLDDPMHQTVAILPFVLIHTVVGGSSGVGRSILIGMGHTRAFATAALLAGGLNVIASFSLVYFFDMGLKGIVIGTIIAVTLRCAVWQPWYVLRTIRRMEPKMHSDDQSPSVTEKP